MTRNYSKVWLDVRRRLDYMNTSMSEAMLNMRPVRERNILDGKKTYYIPRDAKLDGV